MQQIAEFVDKITAVKLMDIVVAICIIVIFRVLSSSISYGIIKLFKLKAKKGRSIKESAFYAPLKVFISTLGIYLAICFLKEPLELSAKTMAFVIKIFKIASIIIFARGLAQSFTPGSTLTHKILKRTDKQKIDSSTNFLLKLIRFVIYAIAIFLIITELGINLNGLIAGFGITGVIITLAAQDTAKNLFGGLVIFLDKPFVVGDWIQFDTYEGTVEDITFRSTRVRTFENSVVNIPNSVISNDSVINWSKMEKRRYKLNLCIQLDTPLSKIEEFEQKVYNMLEAKEAIYDDSIIVRLDGIKENGLNLLICSYTDSVDYTSYLKEVENINYKIMKMLKEEGIELAYDTKTILMKK